MTLSIYNTLTNKKEEFKPLQDGKVGMYVCGVTVYDHCHIGHARAASVFDTIYRYLLDRGYEVNYVRNFTDIDDKIINRAREENIPWRELTLKYIDAFYNDMDRLNIARPTLEPKATEHLQDMIGMISRLVDRGNAYESGGDVYYAVKTFDAYGALSGKNTDDLIAGARVEVDERKRDPLDFALWKSAKPDEPFWESPWGPGRPGWHIECSAMSQNLLGERFDIHGGGKDLTFPHHENEIAQSQGASGQAPVKYWVHNGFVNIDKEKMSKSLGNFFAIRDVLERYHPEALRLFLLSSHYRNPIDFSDTLLDETEKVLSRFYETLAEGQKILDKIKTSGATAATADGAGNKNGASAFTQKFNEAMDDDFNTSVALALMNEEMRTLNTLRNEIAHADPDSAEASEKTTRMEAGLRALKRAGNLLGVFYIDPQTFLRENQERKIQDQGVDAARVEELILERNQARSAKDWAAADRCREALTEMGVAVEDAPEGTIWKIK